MQIEKKYGAKTAVEKMALDQATTTTLEGFPVVKALGRAVEKVSGMLTRTIGTGRGTVAAFFRREGSDVAVWGKADETEHQPNKHCIINNIVNNVKAFLKVVMG